MTSPGQYEVSATLRVIELVETLRRVDMSILHALGVAREFDTDMASTVAITLSEAEVADLVATCDAVAEGADQLQQIADRLPQGEIELRQRTLQAEAEAALSAGVADIERVELLARCLSVRSGFLALAAMLRCTDCHQSWENATLGEVLGRFRETDQHFVRRITALAYLSPELHWSDCDREQVGRLAAVLEQHAATTRCR